MTTFNWPARNEVIHIRTENHPYKLGVLTLCNMVDWVPFYYSRSHMMDVVNCPLCVAEWINRRDTERSN